MNSRQSLRRNEWFLFLTPLLLLVAALLARPLHSKYFPDPIPTPSPTPIPPRIATLWNIPDGGGSFAPILPSPDGATIYTAGKDGTRPGMLNAWDTKTGLLERSFSDAWSYDCRGLALSDDGKLLAYGSDGREHATQTGIYNALDGIRLRVVSTGYSMPCFRPNSHTVFLATNGGFEIWNCDAGSLLKRIVWVGGGGFGNYGVPPSFSPDGKALAVVRSEMQGSNTDFDVLCVYSTNSWRKMRAFSWPNTEIAAFGFVDHGRSLVVHSVTHLRAKATSKSDELHPLSRIWLIDWKSGIRRLLRESPSDSGDSFLTVSRDGTLFALLDNTDVSHVTAGGDTAVDSEAATIEIRKGSDGTKLASLIIPYYCRPALAFAPDDSVLYFDPDMMQRWPRSQWKIGAQWAWPNVIQL